jgi:hypothetical protein
VKAVKAPAEDPPMDGLLKPGGADLHEPWCLRRTDTEQRDSEAKTLGKFMWLEGAS